MNHASSKDVQLVPRAFFHQLKGPLHFPFGHAREAEFRIACIWLSNHLTLFEPCPLGVPPQDNPCFQQLAVPLRTLLVSTA